MDATHNPEFTSIEFYWAYKTYKDLIKLTKEYFYYLLDNLNLDRIIEYENKKVNFDNFQEITFIDSLSKIGGIDKDICHDKNKILAYLQQHNIEVDENLSLGKLQGELFDNFVEDKLIDPTFITMYPVDISPLARRSDEVPYLTERFELFIAGREIANAFSELNDPVDQFDRFVEQVKAKDSGDDEAHHMDKDFVNALSYGMAPTAGEGIGIDRLVMLLTNQHSIRDVILFPAMKPLSDEIDCEEKEC
jgi:lysyl-tRNA synthetase class 2